MKTAIIVLTAVTLFVIGTLCFVIKKGAKLNKSAAKKAFLANVVCFALLAAATVMLPTFAEGEPAPAEAAVATEQEYFTGTQEIGSRTADPNSSAAGLAYLAAALSVSAACIGAGFAVAKGAAAAIGATGEDPKVFGKALIFVTLGEGIAIYGLLIAIMILGKVG